MTNALHARIDRSLAIVENVAAIGAGAAMLGTMVLVSIDVVMRYVFSNPLTFQLHLVQFYLLVSMLMLALPWGYRNGGAIQIQLLTSVLPDRIVNPMVRIGLIAASVYLGALAYQGYKAFIQALTRGEVVMGVIDWPVAWSWVWIPIGCGLLALRLVVDATAPQLRPIGTHE
ncbi:TRAP transporter small permease [Pararhizobium haloflavum]|uniref:TRAP transporter small permease n=1 Tax=Pararhizobium haloflavum TaxID=2037914 RepID=UPI0012FFFF13|nr:TRAP transporter small permease [Pararhizobium haloflavum]